MQRFISRALPTPTLISTWTIMEPHYPQIFDVAFTFPFAKGQRQSKKSKAGEEDMRKYSGNGH